MHPSNGYDEYHQYQYQSSSSSPPQLRRPQPQPHHRHHRRARPELKLTVDTYEANACDDVPDITTPLSPPPSHGHSHAAYAQHAPAIPYKSSQRSLRSALSTSSPTLMTQHPPIPPRSASRGRQSFTDSPQRGAQEYNKVFSQVLDIGEHTQLRT